MSLGIYSFGQNSAFWKADLKGCVWVDGDYDGADCDGGDEVM